jgi:ADP-ribosylglycohydrolase
MDNDSDHLQRLLRARTSLDGLSTADAFGDQFFVNPDIVDKLIESQSMPPKPWLYTDDTVMAISVVDVLAERRNIDQELLAALFAARYLFDPTRGYGGTAHGILTQIAEGESWQEVSNAAFGGLGSMGNGGAMRAAPIGAYFFDNLEAVVENARLSAEITHAHPEGQAGAIAVAIAAACVAQKVEDPNDFFSIILRFTPDSETRARIQQASMLHLSYEVRTAVSALGNGVHLTAQDTVPFALWCAARHIGQFEEALWSTVSGLGDRDTTCAIVGGILTANLETVVPGEWLAARERLEHMSREQLNGSSDWPNYFNESIK